MAATTSDEVLVAAVDLVADTVDGLEPRTMRRRLLSGLVDDLGMCGAVLWDPRERDDGLVLLDEAGLSPARRERLSTGPAVSAVRQLVRLGAGPSDRPSVRRAPDLGLDGVLYVMVLPEPATELLGVLAHRPVDEAFVRLLAALGRAYASALRQAALLRDNQRIVDSLVEDLRPGDVALPVGYTIGHLYRSATANVPIGGDLYDWFRTDRGHLSVAVGDVSGKGLQAASRAAMAVHSLRALALPGAAPHVMAQMLNTFVAGQAAEEGFVTLVYLRIDPATADAEFVVAGHPPPIVLRDAAVEVVSAPSDLPLGVDPAGGFTPHWLRLAAGDRIVLYTDGVTEARSTVDGSLLGVSGLTELLADVGGDAAPQQIADAVWAGVQAFTDGNTTDDCAVLVLGRDEPPGAR